MKSLLLVCLSLILGCAQASAFPTEEEMTARLRPGMSIDEVISAFGQPSTGVPQLPGVAHMRYIAPIGSMTVEKEGYIGFEIELVDGRVKSWRTFLGNPSYAPMSQPREFKWFGLLLRFVFVGAAVYGLIVAVQRRRSEAGSVFEAFRNHDIPTRDLPVEFRFITHDITVKEVIAKAGPYSRHVKFPIDPRLVGGKYTYTDDAPSRPAIVIFEWDMPFHGAVLLMPEYPFESESRIRAVFYRAPRPEESGNG
jgi:hypothetical protein